MLDLKFVRENPDQVRKAMELKGEPADLDRLLQLDRERREMLREAEELKQLRNRVSKEIGRSKDNPEAVEAKKREMREVGDRIKNLDEQLRRLEEEMEQLLLSLPNLPAAEVPPGTGEEDNVEVRRWGSPPTFNFTPRPHWEIGELLGILDFPRAGKISGSRFALYYGDGRPGWSGRWLISCSTCIPVSTATGRSSRRSWSTAPAWWEPGSCPSLPRMPSRWRGRITTSSPPPRCR